MIDMAEWELQGCFLVGLAVLELKLNSLGFLQSRGCPEPFFQLPFLASLQVVYLHLGEHAYGILECLVLVIEEVEVGLCV